MNSKWISFGRNRPNSSGKFGVIFPRWCRRTHARYGLSLRNKRVPFLPCRVLGEKGRHRLSRDSKRHQIRENMPKVKFLGPKIYSSFHIMILHKTLSYFYSAGPLKHHINHPLCRGRPPISQMLVLLRQRTIVGTRSSTNPVPGATPLITALDGNYVMFPSAQWAVSSQFQPKLLRRRCLNQAIPFLLRLRFLRFKSSK